MPAQVRSFDAIVSVRDELSRFSQRAGDGLDEIAGEIRRVIDWVEHDRPAYWKRRVARAYDEVSEARNELNRRLMYRVADEPPACAEEKAALARAQAHLAYCQDKQSRVREWVSELRHELHEYQGRVAHLKTMAETEAPKAVAMLDRALASLERYASAGPPPSPGRPGATPEPSNPAADQPEQPK
ncbi:hypothetical protein [Botrimarina sp.]|uniref:hypothetical protein n=1 Tax=Botrimarina sp. TaxID=2795802 RepID=UPI0032F03EA0